MWTCLFASFLSLAVEHEDVFSSWWKVFEVVEISILCIVPVVFGFLVIIAILSLLCRLTVVVFRVLRKLWLVCCRSYCSSQDNETRPLLDPLRSWTGLWLVRYDPLSVMQCFDPSLPIAQRCMRDRESVETALVFEKCLIGLLKTIQTFSFIGYLGRLANAYEC